MNWLRTFGGGLMVTCGLEQVGPPENDEFGERGLHGLVSNLPAQLESIKQPDPIRGDLDFSLRGTIRQAQIFGPTLELARTISGTLGQPVIRIHDEVTNRANTAMPLMLLYHLNFGWPFVDEGADLLWNGPWQSPGDQKNKRIFVKGNNYKKCPAPLEEHNGPGEEVAHIDIQPDESGRCTAGLFNSKLNLAVAIRFFKKELPWFNNWQHWGKGEYVTGLEPGTNPPIGQSKARAQNQLILLQPGETRNFNVEMEMLTDAGRIEELLKITHHNEY
jgi:hypothetical protein